MSHILLHRNAKVATYLGRHLNSSKFYLSAHKRRSATSTSALDVNGQLKVGDVLHDYKLEQVDHIKELNIKQYYLRHRKTGAEHFHIDKVGDRNNVFAVALRTTPKNSKGVAHILEHLALCGSKKYPIRDPFFKMLTRSLATFMNALTGPDQTVYPFSTQNQKDFENLLRIYLDAVFFPRLRPVDFRQEGWRLEHEKPDKKETPIVIRGVVYNEMKGVFSSSSAIYGRQLLNNIFPDTTYRYESGGDPEHILELSHEELQKFHKLHYHPSNAKFFTYGDLPLENHLKLINELVMDKFTENSQAREQSLVEEQEPWKEPRVVNITCAQDPMSASPDKQTTTSISYMLPSDIKNLDEVFALQILSELLITGPNAPFYKSLLESGLGADYSPCSGLESSTRQPLFSIGLRDVHHDDIGKVHAIIEKTFKETAESGFPQERVDAILHNIELGIKHVSDNFGLKTIMSIGSVWNHDGKVTDMLKINQHVEKFKKDLESDPQYWNKLVTKNFLTNKHQLILTMEPDKAFEEKRQTRENELLEERVSQLDDATRQTILYEGMELQKIQNTKDDLSILPCLEPSKDIPKDLTDRAEIKSMNHNGINVQLCEQPTNEVVYFRALSTVGEKLMAADLIDYLPLFCDVATKLGAGSFNRQELAQKVQLTTGGLGINLMINPSLSDFDIYKSQVLIGSQCLRRNVNNMFQLWSQVFKQIHFQENKDFLHQLIKASASELASSVPFSGNTYASKKAASSLSNISLLDERLSGLTFVARMKDMASHEPVDIVSAKLQQIANIVFNPSNMKCAINAESNVSQSVIDELRNFINTVQEIYSTASDKQAYQTSLDVTNYERTKVEDMKFPFSTHYVAKSLITVPKLHADYSKLVIMSKLISSKYLLPEVREKGGAYGARCALSSSGILSFSSYRDPNTDKTMKVFDYAGRWIEEGEDYTDRDIEESKLGVFQSVDKPVTPGNCGLKYFLHGETDDIRQEYRQRLLEVTKADVQDVARKYLSQARFGAYII